MKGTPVKLTITRRTRETVYGLIPETLLRLSKKELAEALSTGSYKGEELATSLTQAQSYDEEELTPQLGKVEVLVDKSGKSKPGAMPSEGTLFFSFNFQKDLADDMEEAE